MKCCGCKYLKEDKKKEGAVSGTKYYCSKVKNYVYGSDNICDKFEKSYSRDIDTYNKIYKEGINFDDDKFSASFYLIMGFGLLILAIIVYILNPNLYR